ncbi:hypothetical protein [Candidatus Uabimicrobium amorphum]|uniref:Uncharacterized protein n=1 Tax=Uabimicrobium amorphum TaxID=2596890 RepID=A0A5S9F639_UABAM|nr:hypothetical protein [Candidatus Uabimicrobium amorphum]BBM86971.1 hypothetical protein UABAM_05373 [Candidatus Uabimicrobium amorphum]
MRKSNTTGEAAILAIVVILLIAAGAGAWFYMMSYDGENQINFIKEQQYQRAKAILDPIFTDNSSFDSFKKDVVRDKIRLYLDYVYERLQPVIDKHNDSAKFVEEIHHCVNNRQLSAEEMAGVKKFVYETQEESSFQGKFGPELFKKNKDIYILLAYEKLNSLLGN